MNHHLGTEGTASYKVQRRSAPLILDDTESQTDEFDIITLPLTMWGSFLELRL